MPEFEWKRFPVGPLEMNSYLVKCCTTEALMIVDPGDEVERLWQSVENWGGKLAHIILTHGHFDHILQLKRFQELAGLKAMAHAGDEQLFANVSEMAAMFGMRSPGQATVDFTLSEGDRIEFGELSFNILHTPGHSPGSVSLVGHGMAIVGDVLFKDSIGRTDLPGGSFEILAQSIRSKLFTLNDDTIVLSGHGEPTSIGHEKKYNPFLQQY